MPSAPYSPREAGDEPLEPLRLPSDRDHTGRTFGDPELSNLAAVLQSGHLNATGGEWTPRFERAFADRHGRTHGIAVNSGSAAVHTALGALGLNEGDEVITTSITDMGAVLPIVLEGATPVFCDVDPNTGNVSSESILQALTDRTRAVIVTHLFGQIADVREAIATCRDRGVPLIEDAAQAFLATEDGDVAGSLGDLGCFSFQQGKHMTTGEGGVVVCDDDELDKHCRRFVNKGFGYGEQRPDHDRPGWNARWTELQAAVALAQLDRLQDVVDRRRERAEQFRQSLAGAPGLRFEAPRPGTEHSYWRVPLLIDRSVIPGGPDALAQELRPLGVGSAPRYIQKPAFECEVFRRGAEFGALRGLGAEALGSPDRLPGTYAFLDQVLVLPWNEHLTEDQVDGLADRLRHIAERLAHSSHDTAVETSESPR
ncbi:MAG: DegT/DnrJ/EryC1/StrS family aminotransferase [Planctomycetota bacterium]